MCFEYKRDIITRGRSSEEYMWNRVVTIICCNCLKFHTQKSHTDISGQFLGNLRKFGMRQKQVQS